MKKIIALLMILSLCLALAACGGTSTGSGETTSDKDKETASVAESSEAPTADADNADNDGVDIDLTAMSGTMVYSEVLNMQQHPDDYLGKVVKMKGPFNVTKTETNTYFACVIADATACCATGIEFVTADDRKYPQDYPEPQSEITVTGVFNTYMEGKNKYLQLKDAVMVY